jgi:ABC-type dipeptide/oligopeptide/nickel transport system permease component
MGSLIVNAALKGLPVVQGVLVMVIIVLAINLVADLLYGSSTPR